MIVRASIVAAIFTFVRSPAVAETPAPAKPAVSLVRGTIEAFDGKVLKIRTDSGASLSAALLPETRLSAVESRTFAQLKPTDFVGITAVDGPNGHLVAEEIHIIPIAGMGEGQYPWDHHPDAASGPARAGSMTNGTIQASAAASSSSMTNGTVTSHGQRQLKVTFHGAQMLNGKCVGRAVPGAVGCVGAAVVDVTPKTYIQAIVPAKPADVKSGLAFVGGVKAAPDGTNAMLSITVEKDGVKPEF
ncbi:MAG: hypothetical protein JOZ55_07470 [Alphaproteobacteria bacterium]|nr:hypothetical protein [Alphaproteobacteria bacterium]